jgi:hypothetical protein
VSARFDEYVRSIDQVLALVETVPCIHDKETLRYLVDHVMCNVTELTAEQRALIEVKRDQLDAALGRHERGN